MPLTQLPRSQWQTFLDGLARVLAAHRVEIEATGVGLRGVQAEWLPLSGLSYDAGNDALVVAAGGVEHLIRRPTQIHIDQEPPWLYSLEVVDAERNHHFIVFKEPLSLPAA